MICHFSTALGEIKHVPTAAQETLQLCWPFHLHFLQKWSQNTPDRSSSLLLSTSRGRKDKPLNQPPLSDLCSPLNSSCLLRALTRLISSSQTTPEMVESQSSTPQSQIEHRKHDRENNLRKIRHTREQSALDLPLRDSQSKRDKSSNSLTLAHNLNPPWGNTKQVK